MTYEINRKDGNVTVNGNGQNIVLSISDFRKISRAVDYEVYYAEDVETEISDKIDNGELPEEAANNKEYIKDLVNAYGRYREKNDGDELGGSWRDCIYMAFEGIDYEDYAA